MSCKSETEILSNIKSSAYMKLLQHLPFTKQPKPDSCNFSRTQSTYNVNSTGDKIPPCFKPDSSGTLCEIQFFHLTLVKLLLNQFSKTFIIFLLISFFCIIPRRSE